MLEGLVLSSLKRTLHTRRQLVEVCVVFHSSSFFVSNFLLFFIVGLATIKENKGKNVASGTKEEDVQVQDEPAPLAI